MTLKATVVVPVYNPGPALEACIASLLGQSLPADRVEILFVDDGSTDGSDAELDEVAAEAPNVRVIRIPPSGAPGRPRNVGIAEARGEYIHFVDADDILAPRALEWLTDMADRNGSDVVMGKYASASLERSQVVFTHSRPRASLATTPELLTASWAPAKLFRTAMVRKHGITFPEGWRWMEDQLFLLRAYLAARNVSIFADAVCYFFVRRDEGGHLSAEELPPEPHVEHLGEVFDVIEASTKPPLRDELQRRFFRANILRRLDERYLEVDARLRDRIFTAFRGFAMARLDPAIDESFGGANLVRLRMLRAGNATALHSFIEGLEAHQLEAVVRSASWRHGRLVLDVRGQLRHRETGQPLPYLVRDGQTWMDPDLTDGELVDAGISSTMGRVSLVQPQTSLEWLVPSPFAPVVRTGGAHPSGGRRAEVSVVASVEIDPSRVGPARIPLEGGTWSIDFRWSGLGIGRTAPLTVAADQALVLEPVAFGDPARLAVPAFGPEGLRLEVTSRGLHLNGWAAVPSVARQGRTLEIELPVVAGGGAGTSTAEIWLTTPAGRRSWPAEVRAEVGHMRLRTIGRGAGAALTAAGGATLSAKLGAPYDLEMEIGPARVDEAGGIVVAGATDPGAMRRRRRWAGFQARWLLGRTRSVVRQRAVDLAVRLPGPLRHFVVAAYRLVRGRRR